MARPATQTPAAFTMTLKDLMDTNPRYLMELYNDQQYVRVVHGPEEHFRSLKKGWTEEPEEGVIYKPESAHPDLQADAVKKSAALAASKQKRVESQTTLTVDEARQMVREAVAEALA